MDQIVDYITEQMLNLFGVQWYCSYIRESSCPWRYTLNYLKVNCYNICNLFLIIQENVCVLDTHDYIHTERERESIRDEMLTGNSK